jgi:arylamine N-acetyltransferase
MLETVRGEEATRLFMSSSGLSVPGTGPAFLRRLALRFSRFPYENISKIVKLGNSSDLRECMRLPEEVVIDHLERNFGGTCFSLAFLLERMLRVSGFHCYKVMADMNSGRNVHCLVVVTEGGVKCMIDPGYALYEVIPLPGGGVRRVTCPHAVVEVERSGAGAYNVWTNDSTGRKWRYRFRDDPVSDADYETYWMASFGKPTLNNICLTRITPQGHLYFRKDYSRFASRDAISKRRVREGVEIYIQEEFGIGGDWVSLAQKILNERRERTWERRSHLSR